MKFKEGAQLVSEAFKALLKEAEFTKEMLGSGATQIRNANYASKRLLHQNEKNVGQSLILKQNGSSPRK
jgi:hypothetical protein